MSWTQERVQTLKKMWSSGQSASQIASELGGVTRNAVIGKVHRLGLSNRSNSISKEKRGSEPKLKPVRISKNSNPDETKDIKSAIDKPSRKSQNKEKHSSETRPEVLKQTIIRQNKSIIYSANQPLPPQPSTSEISEETLKSVRSLEKKSKKLSLMELTERTCKWPIGDPATDKFWFCGHPAEQGKPYCETHIEIAFQPVASRRDRRSK